MNRSTSDDDIQRKFRCFFGLVHIMGGMVVALAYFAVFNVLLVILAWPFISFYIGIIGLCACTISLFGIIFKNPHIITILAFYAVTSIFFLLYLGGYIFFANVFYKEEVKEALGEKFDDLSILVHFFDVLMLITHYYLLGIIWKCRRYYSYLRNTDEKLRDSAGVPIRSETREEIA